MEKKRVREGQRVALGGLQGSGGPEENQNELGGQRSQERGRTESLKSAPFSPVLALGTSSLYPPGK